jgi:signal transduction histidine kinase
MTFAMPARIGSTNIVRQQLVWFVTMFFFAVGAGHAQNEDADSLLQLLKKEREPSKRIDLLNGVAYFYFDYNDSLARFYAQQALDEAEKTTYSKGKKYALMMVGLGMFSGGDFKGGLGHFKRATTLDSGGDTGMSSYNFLLMGRVYYELAEYDSALLYHQRAFQALEGRGSSNAVANVYRNIAQVLLTQWKNKEAFDYLKKAEAFVIGGNTRNYILAEIQSLLGVYYENTLNFEESERYYLKVCELAREGNAMYHLIKCELRQADLALRRGAYSVALQHCSQAVLYTNKYTYPPQVAEIYHRLGEVYAELSQHDLATQYYFKSLKITEGLGLRYLTARIYSDVAWVLHERKNDNEAFAYIQRSFEIREKIGDHKGLGNCYNVRGLIYLQTNRFEEAIAELERAKIEWQNIGHAEGVAACNYNLALVYIEQGKKDRALELMLLAIETEKTIGNKKSLGASYNGLAHLYIQMGRMAEAERYLKLSNVMAKETRSLTQKRFNYKTYADFYKIRGDYKRAYEFLLRHDEMVDSIYSETSTTKLAEMQALYEVEQKDQKIKLLNQQAQLNASELARQQSDLKMQRTAIIAALIAILLISLLALTIHRSNQRVKKAHMEVVEKNEEIQAQAEELTESNELLTRLHREVTEKNEEIEAQSEELIEANQTIVEINRGLESKIETRTSDLKQAYKELDTFFYRSSHDFRRPLTTFMGLAEVAKITVKDNNALGLFAKVNETAHNLDRMLIKLQSISDIGAQQLIFKEVFLQETIENVIDSFRSEIAAKNIHVHLNIKNQTAFSSYPALVKIIAENLIENAIVFSDPANPQLNVDVISVKKGIEMHVTDNGEGISNEIKDRMFEMYFRGSERSKGNGLGLYIVKKAVEKLHGSISFESEVYKRTEFKVFLPDQSQS